MGPLDAYDLIARLAGEGERYPTCTRKDFIRLLDAAHEEADAAIAAIIKAVEAAHREGADTAVSILARYVIDNGHVREAAQITDEELSSLVLANPNRS